MYDVRYSIFLYGVPEKADARRQGEIGAIRRRKRRKHARQIKITRRHIFPLPIRIDNEIRDTIGERSTNSAKDGLLLRFILIRLTRFLSTQLCLLYSPPPPLLPPTFNAREFSIFFFYDAFCVGRG